MYPTNQVSYTPIIAGRYRLTAKVGTGGMAQVYRAHDIKMGRDVAIKILLPQYASNASFVDHLRTEARAAAQMNSAFSINVYDWGIEGACCYIVMEFVDGFDLKEILMTGGPFHPAFVARIGMQLCNALGEAHARGIVHSDVKPANVMLLRNGNVKIADFGIARACYSGNLGPGGVMGTYRYMSPEQARGMPLTPKSDLYSLGVTLYELGTGTLPFGSQSHAEAPGHLIATPPTPPSHHNPAITGSLERIILKCLQANPDDRYSSARKLAGELSMCMAGLESATVGPIQATGSTTWVLAFMVNGAPTGNAIKVAEYATIGRSKDADIQLVAPEVSNMHARVTSQGALLRIEDLDSSNGTFLNGSPIRGKALCRQGDTLTVGPTTFMIGQIRS